MQPDSYDIQELVKVSGIPRRTIYFYVQQALLPPPEGAGLAAYYTNQHLLRLRLIPILRRQGLRLDEIRQRFAEMSAEEMQHLADEQPSAPPPAPAPGAVLPPAPDPQLRPHPARPVIGPRGDNLLAERHFVHYQLPAGISLVVPAELAQSDQQRLALLLEAAAAIFGSRPNFRHTTGNNGQPLSTADDPS